MEVLTSELTPWHWFIAGIVVCILEVLLQSTFLFWVGIAAIATGLIALVIPLLLPVAASWPVQVALFAVLAVVATIVGRNLLQRNRTPNDQPDLNRRGQRYIGRELTLSEPVVNGVGSITLDSTRWRVVGTDLPSGARVVITGLDGASLMVVGI